MKIFNKYENSTIHIRPQLYTYLAMGIKYEKTWV